MPDREKIIKGLRCIAGDVVWCAHCPYSDANGSGRGDRCKRDCAKEALVWLKEQEAFVRCKDCKYRFENLRCYANNPMVGRLVGDNWFCADGERR